MKLSATGLKLFMDCPRCFWLQNTKKIKRPSGPFPSLPGGIDEICKNYFDKYRVHPRYIGKLPPEVEAIGFKGSLFGMNRQDKETLDKWRNFRKSDLEYVHTSGDVLYAVLDDLLIDENGLYVPFDYKSRRGPPKEETNALYTPQINVYALCLNAKGYKTTDYGYLDYYYPVELSEGAMIEFKCEIVKIKTSSKYIIDILDRALECLKDEEEPKANVSCSFCKFTEIIKGEDKCQKLL